MENLLLELTVIVCLTILIIFRKKLAY